MALCGFNKKMLAGLTMFSEGLYEQVPKRAVEDSLSVEDSVKQELSEMETFLAMLQQSSKDVRFLTGVTFMAQSLYLQSLESDGDNSLSAIELRYKAVADSEVRFCSQVDGEYYGNLRPNASSPHVALKQLGPWIESHKK